MSHALGARTQQPHGNACSERIDGHPEPQDLCMATEPSMVISAASGPQSNAGAISDLPSLWGESMAAGGQWLACIGGIARFYFDHQRGEPHVFYAASNKGIFRSTDTGLSWEALAIRWPTGTQLGRVNALIAVPI